MNVNGIISILMAAYKAVKIAGIFLVAVGFILTVTYFCLWYLLTQRQRDEEFKMQPEAPTRTDSNRGLAP